MKRLFLLLICVTVLGCQHVHGQLFAMKTNALLDVAMVPNLGLELITGEKTSLSAAVFGTTGIWGQKIQMIGAKPEFRYWFNGRPLTREFIGLGASIMAYDITWSGQRYKGDAYTGAITFGYDFILGPHWSMECHAGIGLLYYDQQRYYLGDRVRNNYYNADGFHLLPYDLGVTFVWIINKKTER